MRLIIDAYDLLAPLVKYLNWSDVPRTLRLFQGALVSIVVLYLVGPLVPLRFALLVGGEAALIAHHPWVKPSVEGILKYFRSGRAAQKRILRNRRFMQRLTDLLDEDRLPESVWASGWRDVELFENQRYRPKKTKDQDSRWTASALRPAERRPWTKASDGDTPLEATQPDTYQGGSKQAITLEPGWEWVDQDDWRIDWGGAWSSVGVDANGYMYTDDAWMNPAPYAYGTDPKAPAVPARLLDEDEDEDEDEDTDVQTPKYKAVTRRRRWLRRAVRVKTA